MHMRGWASAAGVALALALALVLVACGGDGEDEAQVARIGGGTTTTQDGRAGSKDPEEAMLAFARCMREQGVDVGDPRDGMLVLGPGGGGGGRPSAAEQRRFERADEECRHDMKGVRPPALSEEDQRALQEASLEHVRCMREHGIDLPDPDFSGGRAAIELGSDFDPNDPDFRAAEKACAKHLRSIEDRLDGARQVGP